LKICQSLGTDEISAGLVQAGDRPVCCEVHKLTSSVWNKEELPQKWKMSVIPLYKKGNKSGSCWGISLLSAIYKIISTVYNMIMDLKGIG
jgi:hypothetical protein